MRRPFLAFVLAVLLIALPEFAAGAELRYSGEVYGGIAMTGNAIGLSKQLDVNGPGTEDSIGTFMALDPSDVDDSPSYPANPWFTGTTYDWLADGSSAELVLPSGAEVLYAELVWAGSYNYSGEDVSAYIGTAVTVYHEGAGGTRVIPDPSTAVTLAESAYSGFLANYYMRSADVTGYVAAHGQGTYTVGGIPATQGEAGNSLNAGGWALLVVYDDPSEAWPSHVDLHIGAAWIDEDNTLDFTSAGFAAATAGTVTGRILLGALEGDANTTGDTVEFSAPAGTASLQGTNNPVDNFFASQVNSAAGVLDTTGTFGTRNHDAGSGVQVSGGRQGWDITGIPLSSGDAELAYGQTAMTVVLSTTGDNYMPVFFALEITSDGPERDIRTGGGGGGGCAAIGSVPSGPAWPGLLAVAVMTVILMGMRKHSSGHQG